MDPSEEQVSLSSEREPELSFELVSINDCRQLVSTCSAFRELSADVVDGLVDTPGHDLLFAMMAASICLTWPFVLD